MCLHFPQEARQYSQYSSGSVSSLKEIYANNANLSKKTWKLHGIKRTSSKKWGMCPEIAVAENCWLTLSSLGLQQCLVSCCGPCITLSGRLFCLLSHFVHFVVWWSNLKRVCLKSTCNMCSSVSKIQGKCNRIHSDWRTGMLTGTYPYKLNQITVLQPCHIFVIFLEGT